MESPTIGRTNQVAKTRLIGLIHNLKCIMHNFCHYFIGTINLLSGLLFIFDKQAAIKGRRRFPERTLHFFEILGGVFANIFLMYALHHKNRKFNYWIWTWLIMIGWVALIITLFRNQYFIQNL